MTLAKTDRGPAGGPIEKRDGDLHTRRAASFQPIHELGVDEPARRLKGDPIERRTLDQLERRVHVSGSYSKRQPENAAVDDRLPSSGRASSVSRAIAQDAGGAFEQRKCPTDRREVKRQIERDERDQLLGRAADSEPKGRPIASSRTLVDYPNVWQSRGRRVARLRGAVGAAALHNDDFVVIKAACESVLYRRQA